MKHLSQHATSNLTKVKSLTACFSKSLSSLILCITIASYVNAQSVSGIITDYNSYWKTSATSINAIKPTNSHNLLAFTYNNIQYSTGVNDQALTNHGESFVAGDYWSLPVAGFTGTVTSNTKIALGEMYDGVHNGASNPAPVNNIGFYLTDGIKGLNIGTGVANLPAGTILFNVNTISVQNIGDGIPDIVVTQIADPSGSTDSYSFVDASGNVVGHKKDMLFTSITPIANWTADFYEAVNNPLTLTGGYTNTDRQIRMWAADLSDFGITAANYQSVKKFSIALSGNSDVAFVAYNNKAFNISSALPVTLSDFSGKEINSKTQINWTTETEENTSNFSIERSSDNRTFTAIADIAATGNSATTKHYTINDNHPANGNNYYRLKMSDKDGSYTYSKVIMIQINAASTGMSIYPNPASDNVVMTHPATKGAGITLYNTSGIAIVNATVAANTTQTRINVQPLAKGIYFAVWENGTEKTSIQLIKK
ncbi:MAG: T9SS type A sorting domain-containing protein [Bacteroidota bacterium]